MYTEWHNYTISGTSPLIFFIFSRNFLCYPLYNILTPEIMGIQNGNKVWGGTHRRTLQRRRRPVVGLEDSRSK